MVYQKGNFSKDIHERSFRYSRGRLFHRVLTVPFSVLLNVPFFNAIATVTVPFFTPTVRSVILLKH